MKNGSSFLGSFKPDFFVRNNLEPTESRVLVSKWTPCKGWQKIATGYFEINFSIECCRIYFHFIEKLGQQKLFEIDLYEFSYKVDDSTKIVLRHKNASFDIALTFERASAASKYLGIITSFTKIKDQILEITKYKEEGKCIFLKLRSIFTDFKFSCQDDYLGSLLWFRYNNLAVFNNELATQFQKSFNDKEALEKLLGVIVTLYSFKDTTLFTGLIDDNFFELTHKIRNRFVTLVSGSVDEKFEVHSRFKWIKGVVENEEVSDAIWSILKFRWVFIHVLEPYLDSRDLSAYSTFLKICDAKMCIYITSRTNTLSLVEKRIESWDSYLISFNIFLFGNHEAFDPGPSLHSKIVEYILSNIAALEFVQLDDLLMLKIRDSAEEKTKLMNQIELLAILSQKNTKSFVELFVSTPQALTNLFCLFLSDELDSLSLHSLLNSIMTLPDFSTNSQSSKAIASALYYLLDELQVKFNISFIRLLHSLLLAGFAEQVKNALDCATLLRKVITLVQEEINNKPNLSIIASMLNDYVSCFRFITNNELLGDLLIELIKINRSQEGLLWCQLGAVAKTISQTAQGTRLLGQVFVTCKDSGTQTPRWLETFGS